MRNGMADYVTTVLDNRGIPYDKEQSDSGCIVFSFDNRMISKSAVNEIFEDAFSSQSGGYVEAKIARVA